MAYINYKGENIDVGELPENASSEQKRAALFKARPGLEIEYRKFLANKQGQEAPRPESSMENIENAVANDVNKINQGELPSGAQPETVPQQMTQALLNAMAAPKSPSEGHQRFYNLLKNLFAGSLRALGGEEEPMKHYAKQQGGFQGVPEPTNYSEIAGLSPEQVSEFQQGIPGAALSMAIPNPIGRAGQAAGLAERGARLGGRAGIEAVKDALITAQSNPENAAEAAKVAAMFSGGGQSLADFAGSPHWLPRALKKLIAPSIGGYLGYKATEGSSAPVQGAATLAGIAGGHGLGTGLSRGISGPRVFQQPAGASLQKTMGPAERKAYDIRDQAFENLDIPGTLAEKTGSEQHFVSQGKAAQNPKDIQLFENFVRDQDSAINRTIQNKKNDIFNTERAENLKKDYKKTWKTANHDISSEVSHKYMDDANFKKYEDMLFSEPERAQKYGKLDPNSLEYLDGIHRMNNARITQIEEYLANPKPGKTVFTSSDLHEAQKFDKEFVKDLDRASPNNMYEKVRREAEYKILGDKIKNYDADQFLQMFKNPERKKEFLHALRGNDELIKRVNDFETVLKSIRKIDTASMAKNLKNIDLLPTSMAEASGTVKAVLNKTINAPYSKAATELFLDPNSGNKLHELAEMNNTEKLAELLAKIISKTHAQEYGSKSSKKNPRLNININPNKPVTTIEEGAQ